MKHALITGITGQDGSYLSELLLEMHQSEHFRSGGLIKAAFGIHGADRLKHVGDAYRVDLRGGDRLFP